MVRISIEPVENSFVDGGPTALTNFIISFCNDRMQKGDYFTIDTMKSAVRTRYPSLTDFKAEIVSNTILLFLKTWNRCSANNYGRFFVARNEDEKEERYRITGSGFSDIPTYLRSNSLEVIDERGVLIEQSPMDKSHNQRLFALLGLLDTCQILSFEVMGGGEPEIFIRVNSYYRLYAYINNPASYSNRILTNVRNRHKISVRMLDFLFREIGEDSELFWDHIQNYFLGKLPRELLAQDT